MQYLDECDVLSIHQKLSDLFAAENDPISPSGLRDANMLGSALSRPRTSLGGTEKYKSVDAKAAALLHSLVKNHPFRNGNKRTALVALLVFLRRNDRRLEASESEIFELLIAVASDQVGTGAGGNHDDAVEAIRRWLSSHLSTVPAKPRTMKLAEFLALVERAGCQVKTNRGSCKVKGPRGGVTISRSTPELAGQVVKKYLSILGLSQGQTGFPLAELESVAKSSGDFIDEYRPLLRRLAKL
jgi:death-on-curing family protein